MEHEKLTSHDAIQRSAILGMTALGGFSVPKFGYGANLDHVKVGLVGCGGRGTGAARDILTAVPNVHLTAMGDLFPDVIPRSLENLKQYRGPDKQGLTGIEVSPDHCFSGLDAYQQVIDSGIDIVLLCTPPAFRPEHSEYAVQRGVHIFAEKPCATDPAGVQHLLALEPELRRKGLAYVAGLQSRHAPAMQEAIRRIQDGDIGEVLSCRIYRMGGSSRRTTVMTAEQAAGMSPFERRMRDWYVVDWLYGDYILETALHQIDLVPWILGRPPATAYGSGGMQYFGNDAGNIYDHMFVEYDFTAGVRAPTFVRQIPFCDEKAGVEVVGTTGTARLMQTEMEIRGSRSFRWPEGWVLPGGLQEHATLVRGIRDGAPVNQNRLLCEGTLIAIMGREAAYTGKVVTWEDINKSTLNLAPADIASWDGSIRPVPKPGTPRR